MLRILHKSPILLDDFIDRWLHFHFFQLLWCEPDESDESFFFLDVGFPSPEIFDEIEMNIFIDCWMTSLMASSKWKRDSFDKFFDAKHRRFQSCFFRYFTNSGIGWCFIIFCMAFWKSINYLASWIFPFQQKHLNNTPMTAIDNASGTLLKKMWHASIV